uniref:Cell division protein DamX, binds to the septal ring, contains C-terminal SPOR domain n=1 Tax=Candidatus Kentrum sp. TUN TaxID=2126343 RepID=A0A450ZCD7_9GAMM|nr:MAG: Cell division protein DamX, binds to the septal ring, contains C-terminal SPOR domain [Candidatus Kentron sp. TUN]
MITKYFQRRGEILSDPLPESSLIDDFFFTTPALTQRLDLLRHLIGSSGFLLILSGERGSGKSTLLKHLFTSADPQWEICAVPPSKFSANDTTQPKVDLPGKREVARKTLTHTRDQRHFTRNHRKLPERLLEGFNLSLFDQDANSIQDTLFAHIRTLCTSGKLPLIVVGDSKILSSNDIQLLAELSYGNQRLDSRIILICQPEDTRRIRELIVAVSGDELAPTVDIPPLDEEQVGDYLHLRWNRTNPVGDDPFTDRVIRSIYHASKGLPANIDRLADRFLQNRRPNSNRGTQTRRGARTVNNFALSIMATRQGKLIAITAGIVLLVIVFFLIVADREPQSGTETLTLPIPTSTINTREVEPMAIPGNDGKPEAISSRKAPLPFLSMPRAFIPQESTSQGATTSTRSSTLDSASRRTDTTNTKNVEQNSSHPLAHITVPTVATKPLRIAPSREIDHGHKDAKTQFAKTDTRLSRASADRASSENRVDLEKQQLARASRHTPARTITWLRQQDKNHYVIQLLGTSRKGQMQEFLDKHKLGSRVAWFKTKRNNRSWFVVVYGIYPTRKAASAGIQALPKVLRRREPWPRNIGKILAVASRD